MNAERLLAGREPVSPPPESALGALCRYISAADPVNYQPTNIAFGLLPPPPESGKRMGKTEKRALMVERALASLDLWLKSAGTAPTWRVRARRTPLQAGPSDEVRASPGPHPARRPASF